MNRPKKFSTSELKKVQVSIVLRDPLFLFCNRCLATWWPEVQPGAALPRGYWKCPNAKCPKYQP